MMKNGTEDSLTGRLRQRGQKTCIFSVPEYQQGLQHQPVMSLMQKG